MDTNEQFYSGRLYKNVINTPNKDMTHATPSNTYRRRRNLHSHHHYQRVRLKSAPPTGGGFLYNFSHHDAMVVSGIGATSPNMNNETHPMKNNDNFPKVELLIFRSFQMDYEEVVLYEIL